MSKRTKKSGDGVTTPVADDAGAVPPVPAPAPVPAQPHHGAQGPLRLLAGLACVIIVIFGLHYASGVLNPVLLALFVVMGASPMIRWLRAKGLPGWATMLIMLVLIVVIGLLFISVLAASLWHFQDKIPVYQDRLQTIYTQIDQWAASHGIDTGDLLGSLLSPEKLAGLAKDVASGLLSSFSNVLLMFLVMIFMIAEIFQFPAKLEARYGAETRFRKAMDVFTQETRSYLFMKTWLAAIAAVINTGVFYALGVDFPLLWGMLFFLLSYIPNFGFILSIIPPFAVTLLEQSFTRAIILVAIMVALNFVVDSVISPRVMGRGLGLTPLAVLLSLILWTWVFGPVGALISVPLTLLVKRLFFESFESTQFLSDALSSRPGSREPAEPARPE
jgi:AI-2 transport protein TqsA